MQNKNTERRGGGGVQNGWTEGCRRERGGGGEGEAVLFFNDGNGKKQISTQRDRESDRQTDRPTDRQTERQADRQAET